MTCRGHNVRHRHRESIKRMHFAPGHSQCHVQPRTWAARAAGSAQARHCSWPVMCHVPWCWETRALASRTAEAPGSSERRCSRRRAWRPGTAAAVPAPAPAPARRIARRGPGRRRACWRITGPRPAQHATSPARPCFLPFARFGPPRAPAGEGRPGRGTEAEPGAEGRRGGGGGAAGRSVGSGGCRGGGAGGGRWRREEGGDETVPHRTRLSQLFRVLILFILSLLSLSRSAFLVLYPGQHYVCVCVRACFHIVLHVSGISGIQITSLKHMLVSLSLFVSCLLVLARL